MQCDGAMTAVPLSYTCGAFVKFYYLRKVPTFVLERTHSARAPRKAWFKRHARQVGIDAINYATKYNFSTATESSLMNLYLN